MSLTILGTAVALMMALRDTVAGFGVDGERVALITLLGVLALIQLRWVPLFLQLEAPAPGELLRPSREFGAELTDDPPYLKDCERIEKHNSWMEAVNDPARKPWFCASCGEENPATFDICWKCQKPNEKQQGP